MDRIEMFEQQSCAQDQALSCSRLWAAVILQAYKDMYRPLMKDWRMRPYKLLKLADALTFIMVDKDTFKFCCQMANMSHVATFKGFYAIIDRSYDRLLAIQEEAHRSREMRRTAGCGKLDRAIEVIKKKREEDRNRLGVTR